MAVVVGVDGGGTSTRAVVLDADGREVARATAPGAVATAKDPGTAASAVAQAVRSAARSAGIDLPAKALWAGLSGAGRHDVRDAVAGALLNEGLAESVTVGTDVEAAFFDAFGSGRGVLLIAGTGSIALARGPAGALIRAGGWGQHMGDEGSGYWLGIAALRAVATATDGRARQTALTPALMTQLSLQEPSDLIAWSATAAKADVAALAPSVAQAAASGDHAAREIVAQCAHELRRHVEAVVARTGPWPTPPTLALWGGLIWQDGPLRAAVEEAIADIALPLLDRDIDPPRGAARLALEGAELG